MEHVRQYDWSVPTDYEPHFVAERDLDNCVTERLLRNVYYDPLVNLNGNNAKRNPKINWGEVFKRKNREFQHRVFIPGMKASPPYPRLSALSPRQHYQCIKVLSFQNPHVLAAEQLQRPTNYDYKIFEDVKQIYEKEQKEYIEWANNAWMSGICARALRPKPHIETLYEGEYKLRSLKIKSFPRNYTMAAQITMECNKQGCELVHKKDLSKVNLSELPQVDYPYVIENRLSVIRPCSVPEPCNKHPCKFILPNEKSMSSLPLTEVNRELAQYAAESRTEFIASESAVKCLMETDRSWTLPITVCETIMPDGEKMNVTVFGSEFFRGKESALTRTYRAYKFLLQAAFIPASEIVKLSNNRRQSTDSIKISSRVPNDDLSSDDEDDRLLIDIQGELNNEKTGPDKNDNTESDREETCANEREKRKLSDSQSPAAKRPRLFSMDIDDIGIYNCVCKDSIIEKPPPRSYRLWEARNKTDNRSYQIIVHCPHKTKGVSNEVVLEPIPEYQIDYAATKQSEEKIQSLGLSLMLRKNADLINVRIVAESGEVVTIERLTTEEYLTRHASCKEAVNNRLYATLDNIWGLMPGEYLLAHEPSHGLNALLYRVGGDGGESISLDKPAATPDEAKSVKTPPVLEPTLLPFHKFRKILPCAFTPFENQLVKDTRKIASRQKTPPQALRWPKRKRKGKRH